MRVIVRLVPLIAAALALMAGSAYGEATSAEFRAYEGSYPASVSGSGEAGSQAFITEGGSIECAYTVSGTLAEASQTLTLHPEYSECTAFGFLEATVDSEECNLELDVEGVNTEGEGVYDGSTSLTCPSEQSLKVTAATCALEFPGWSWVKKLAGWLVHNPLININLTININSGNTTTYNVTNDGFLCPLNGTGKKTDGEYETYSPLLVEAPEGIEIS